MRLLDTPSSLPELRLPPIEGPSAKWRDLEFKDRKEGPHGYKFTNNLDVGIHSPLSLYLSEQMEVQDVQRISASQDQGQETPPTDSVPVKSPTGGYSDHFRLVGK